MPIVYDIILPHSSADFASRPASAKQDDDPNWGSNMLTFLLALTVAQFDLHEDPGKQPISECESLVFQPVDAIYGSSWPEFIKPTFKNEPYYEIKKTRTTYISITDFAKILVFLDKKAKQKSVEPVRRNEGYTFWCGDNWVGGVLVGKRQGAEGVEADSLVTGFSDILVEDRSIKEVTEVISAAFRRAQRRIPAYILAIEKKQEIPTQ